MVQEFLNQFRADARWVARLAAGLQLPCLTGKRDVRAEAGAAGISLETAGRRARVLPV